MKYSEMLNEKYKAKYIEKEIDCLKTICLNITDFCNINCQYCPHIYGFKNTKDNLMTLSVVKQLVKRLKEINYNNRITISGFGEPTTHPYLIDILYELKYFNVDLLTNGLINHQFKDDIIKLTNNIIVSLHYEKDLETVKNNWPTAIIRNHDIKSENCELKITNRAGFINSKKTNYNICTCPFYKLMIDFDGSYLLCADDFNRNTKNKSNIFNTSIEEYFNIYLTNIKKELINNGRINISPCNICDIDGTLYGLDIVEWYKNHELK